MRKIAGFFYTLTFLGKVDLSRNTPKPYGGDEKTWPMGSIYDDIIEDPEAYIFVAFEIND